MTFAFNREDLARYFIANYDCWYCGKNRADSFHHIIPVSDNSHCSSSLLNASPMCNYPCHINNHGRLVTKEYQIKLLAKTMRYLINQGYELKEKDIEFIRKNKMLFDEVLKII